MKDLNRYILQVIFVSALLFFGNKVILAETFHVPDDYTKIQNAIDSVNNGDTIIVADGTYYENINFNGSKKITVRSEHGSDFTEIDGTGLSGGSLVTFTGGDCSTLKGFTITNGCGTYNDYFQLKFGGGMYMNSSAPTVTDCKIINNSASGDGGGIYCFKSSPTFDKCIISGNDSEYSGGGVFACYLSQLILTNCEITGNKAMNGAALWFSSSLPTITNCTISGNIAEHLGGGILSYYSSSPNLTNCILWQNLAGTSGDEVYIYDNTSSITISYSDIDHSLIEGPGAPILDNNINADPLFVDPLPATEAPTTAGDYHLKAGSPCIDIGLSDKTTYPNLPSDDLDGDNRPEGAGYDMGTDEVVHKILHVGPGQPFFTIQSAIDEANKGDIVLVYNGTYAENINFKGKAITVRSTNGASLTTIDGRQGGSVVTFNSGESSNSCLDGFTITNGNGNDIHGNGNRYGGGILLYASSSPLITNCSISNNIVSDEGAGIACLDKSSPTISNCTIKSNKTDTHGGGIYISYYSSPVIENCTIRSNTAGFYGGGISCQNHASPIITNCSITGNQASHWGGGIHAYYYSSPMIVNSTITGNSASIYGGGIICHDNASPSVVNTILWGDIAGGNFNEINIYDTTSSIIITYSDIQGGWPGIGNIDSDPLFIGSGDYHLTASSQCIDAANSDNPAPTADKENNYRVDNPDTSNTGTGVNGDYYDIGAYEYTTG